jgi:hypothetical protein
MVRLPDPTPSGSGEAMALPDLPPQFDLELDAVVTELQLDLDLELVVPRQVIGQGVQASRHLLARQPISFLDLEKIHPRSLRPM